tara:strand:+ start:802 stop:1467 length:666 start_codon:yes stop_codon:yes gene_type:complete
MIDYINYGKKIQKEPQNTPNIKIPNQLGWMEYKLNTQEMDYIWKCINMKQEKMNKFLAGNIDSSFVLEDKNDWFFNNTLTYLINACEKSFGPQAGKVPVRGDNIDSLSYKLSTWWVNYQKQYEFNPSHNHTGVYSFVIWLKIPYEWEEQNKDNIANSKVKGAFTFQYINILGEMVSTSYKLGKKYEGTMLFFPSGLHHSVYPFYNCEEDRISVSGNILLKV